MSRTRTYVDKPLGDTAWLLEQWGYWRMDGRGIPGYVSQMAAVMSRANPVGRVESYSITDEHAEMMDKALARLMRRDRQMGDFVWFYYGAKWPANRIGRENQMSERKAWELIKAGVAWIDGALEHTRDAA
ncbi:TPA: antitermination protein Q [Pseudomonas aeruginosa]|nr:antitermination protein Q [Pseudomonas aeruginosa]MBG6580717.1 antitermination protein Q [Pseudomonas aeruginosa]MBH4337149.1 antitermination protein Q [Pseudomonas aeruginosa]MBI7160204.1 antitermination protein Q [Pseudomonas aeruginosa]HCF2609886.1 antitermination protein Q [Pseudomonas aeruginosa]